MSGVLQPDQALAQFGAAEAWLSLASYVLNDFYSPASRRKDIAGGAPGRLRGCARSPMRCVSSSALLPGLLGSVVFSVGVSFPLGASIGISWGLSGAALRCRRSLSARIAEPTILFRVGYGRYADVDILPLQVILRSALPVIARVGSVCVSSTPSVAVRRRDAGCPVRARQDAGG
jgi:hypothetical protein